MLLLGSRVSLAQLEEELQQEGLASRTLYGRVRGPEAALEESADRVAGFRLVRK